MHDTWNYVPKRLLVSTKTHVTVFDHRQTALCGAGMPKQKRGDSAVLPFVLQFVDCGHCLTILSCHPQNNPLVKRHMFPRWDHTELPKNKWGWVPSCSAYQDKATIVPTGHPNYFSVSFKCSRDPKHTHHVTTRHVWPETVNPWW